MKIFFIDCMLKKLSRWLNILGFLSVAADETMKDNDILKICKDNSSILLTKDKELAMRAKKRKIKTILLRERQIENELFELFSKLNWKNIEFFKNKLCPFCAINLEPIEKEKIKDKVPKGTYNNFDDYWICKNCEKIFWKGIHWDKIYKVVEKLKEKLKQNDGVGGI